MQDEWEDQAPEIESLNENTVNPEDDVTDEDLEDVSGGSCTNNCFIN